MTASTARSGAAHCEILKFAALLDVEPAELGFLAGVPAHDVRTLRLRASDHIHDVDTSGLAPLVQAASSLPLAVIAPLAERTLGPALSAQLTPELDPDRAVELARRFKAPFLAKLAAELDPRCATTVVARLSPGRISAVAAELARRSDYITLGRFAGSISPEVLDRVIDELDEVSLLHVAYFAEPPECVREVMAGLDDDRIAAVIRAAAKDGLWRQLLTVSYVLTQHDRARMAKLAATLDDDVLESLIASTCEDEMWDELLPLVKAMDNDSRARIASLPMLQSRDDVDAVIESAAANLSLRQLMPLLAVLPRGSKVRAVKAASGVSLSKR